MKNAQGSNSFLCIRNPVAACFPEVKLLTIVRLFVRLVLIIH